MAFNSLAAFRAAALLTRACSLARASSALRASTAAAPPATTSHHINITTFLQFPKIDVDIGKHTLRLLESLVHLLLELPAVCSPSLWLGHLPSSLGCLSLGILLSGFNYDLYSEDSPQPSRASRSTFPNSLHRCHSKCGPDSEAWALLGSSSETQTPGPHLDFLNHYP